MASLWSLVSKRKVGAVSEDLEEILREEIPLLLEWPPHLVNVTDFVQNFKAQAGKSQGAIDFTPCHVNLWLEWIDERREAILISRYEVDRLIESGWAKPIEIPQDSRHLVDLCLFREHQAMAVAQARASIFIDTMGQPYNAQVYYSGTESNWPAMQWRIDFAAEIITIMNTRGTRIEPPLARHSEIVKPNRAPHSVWHTIHLPRFQAPPLENAIIDGPVLERREHWVRAHRRDYRKGAGMFGRVKALVWVSEYQRGNPELGTVQQSFKVHPQ